MTMLLVNMGPCAGVSCTGDTLEIATSLVPGCAHTPVLGQLTDVGRSCPVGGVGTSADWPTSLSNGAGERA